MTPAVVVVLVMAMIVAACGGSDQTDRPADEGVTVCDGCTPAAIDDGWEIHDRRWFVYDITAGQVLEARAEANFNSAVVADLRADATGLVVYTGGTDSDWVPVAVGDGAGWVPRQFLRPEPSVPEPTVVGTATPELTRAATAVVAGLGDGPALADLVDSSGVMISFDAELGAQDVTVRPDELADPTAQDRDWGVDARGVAVAMTLDEVLHRLVGSTALTSTETIGYDQPVSSEAVTSAIIETAASGDHHVVEYHFGGTGSADLTDWASLYLVFDTQGGAPLLVAVVADHGPAAL